MKKTILQHFTKEHQSLYDFTGAGTKTYAQKLGFDYLVNSDRRCPDRIVWWEKIAYIKETLPKLEENSFVVWIDADSIILTDDSLEDALPSGGIFGMIQNRSGLNFSQPNGWYNAGMLFMKNTSGVRNFIERVWNRTEDTDEKAINAELKLHNGIVADQILISDVAPVWNCWQNNLHLCKDIKVRSFHGIHGEKKLAPMQSFMKSR